MNPQRKDFENFRKNVLHGIVVTETLSGSLVHHQKFTSKFGLPSFCKESSTSMGAMNMGALLFALENFAASVGQHESNRESSALQSFELDDTHIFLRRAGQYTISAIFCRDISIKSGEVFLTSLSDYVLSENFSFDRTPKKKVLFLS